jgi:hypothetical protein
MDQQLQSRSGAQLAFKLYNLPAGWIAERLEWYTFFWLAKDEKGVVRRITYMSL